MGNVINLRDAPHHPAQYLLPWYVNGTLNEADAAAFEEHLADCVECQDELELETRLAAGLMAVVRDPEFDIGELPVVARPRGSRLGLFRRRIPLGWAVAAQLAAAALFLAILLPGPQSLDGNIYHVAGSSRAPRVGNVIVLFAATAREEDVRQTLARAGARIVDGPTESGAYLLDVSPQSRRAALTQLRGATAVTLAEPIGGD